MATTDQNLASDCPLDRAAQTRNLLLFAGCTGLQYLAAPIGYVTVQASLCKMLGASDATANLPQSVYLGLTFAPVIFAWYVPYVDWLKKNLVICYGTAAVSQALVAVVLPSSLSPEMKIAAVIAQSAIAGIVAPSGIAFLWEVLGRGAAERRRGLALSLAFGIGPLFAALGSLGSQLVLKGSLGPVEIPGLGSFGPLTLPGLDDQVRFAIVYLCAAPAMAVAALLSCLFIVAPPQTEMVRQPFAQAVFGGLWDFLKNPVLLTAAVATILIYTGNTITSNLNLYSTAVFGDAPMLHAGNQSAVRFAFKAPAGLLLGWLLTRTNPKAGLLATAIISAASLGWAMVASADLYLLTFGIYGAGELVGVAAPNYILSASRPEHIRRNMAFAAMLMAPAAPTGYLFGTISDVCGAQYGVAAGYRISFAVCAAIMLAGIALAAVKLPARPSRESTRHAMPDAGVTP
jgi:MFS family permease